MKLPNSSPGRAAVAIAAAALLSLGFAGPALAAPADTASDASPGQGSTAPLTVSPSAGAAGTAVTVRATCEPSSRATSEAFQENIRLLEAGRDLWVGSGLIRETGLDIGSTYPVELTCANGVTLSTTFTFTAGTPSGGASAGFGGDRSATGTDGDTQATALAVGGGVAVAGAAGYVFLSRRRRSGNHYY